MLLLKSLIIVADAAVESAIVVVVVVVVVDVVVDVVETLPKRDVLEETGAFGPHRLASVSFRCHDGEKEKRQRRKTKAQR